MSQSSKEIFKRGSKTYYTASIFFPPEIKKDVFTLYAYVRTADDFVDSIPQDVQQFFLFKKETAKAWHGHTDIQIISAFIDLAKRKRFEKVWVDAFLSSMEEDLTKKEYKTLIETEQYIYGSANVIGLMMARIMDLPESSLEAAATYGKAMQYINFIRDIAEDNDLGRCYFPSNILHTYGLNTLSEAEAKKNPEQFRSFIREEIKRYEAWAGSAEHELQSIPKQLRIPIKTAGDMYAWTAKQIAHDPFIVYRCKVKPSRWRILRQIGYNVIS